MVDIEQTESKVDEKIVLSDFHLKELLEMIRTLPLGCQIIFNMYALEGYSHKEIAESLNISDGTSKSQYARAKMLLRKKINESRDNKFEQIR
jgi:RNA polymerase sigma-70 factor (ECF subfamily)